MCTGGAAPSTLNVLPVGRPMCGGPAAHIGDVAPIVNIPPFGVCNMSPIPLPCVPVPAGTWTPGNPKVLVGGLPALTSDSRLMCGRGGVISVAMPGQFVTMVA